MLETVSCSRGGDSRALYYRGEQTGLVGNGVDGTARQGSQAHRGDERQHLAKVRVAGSNPVFRSRAGQGRFFNAAPHLAGVLRFRPEVAAECRIDLWVLRFGDRHPEPQTEAQFGPVGKNLTEASSYRLESARNLDLCGAIWSARHSRTSCLMVTT